MTPRKTVPPRILAELRSVCLGLPETSEEAAWVGTRWQVRKRAYAHVLMVDAGWPPAYARAAGSDGPLCVLTFRNPTLALNAFAFTQAPFFRPGWWPDIAGMALGERVDWAEVAGLVTQSYCVMAPKKLAREVCQCTGHSQ